MPCPLKTGDFRRESLRCRVPDPASPPFSLHPTGLPVIRTIFFIGVFVVSTSGFGGEPSSSTNSSQPTSSLRYDFETKPAGELVGEAAIDDSGPTAENYVGLPEHNRALRLDG